MKMMKVDAPTRRCAESRMNPESKTHAFWDTQPVPSMRDELPPPEETGGPIEVKKVEDVRQTPYPLPEAFEW